MHGVVIEKIEKKKNETGSSCATKSGTSLRPSHSHHNPFLFGHPSDDYITNPTKITKINIPNIPKFYNT